MELKAKTVSLVIKIFVIVFVTVCSILKWCNIFPNCEIKEVCLVAGTIAAIFGDVSINTALDKFTKKVEEDA